MFQGRTLPNHEYDIDWNTVIIGVKLVTFTAMEIALRNHAITSNATS